MNGDEKTPKAPPRFRSLLRRWKEEDDKCGSGDFEFAEPKREKSVMAQQNEQAIKEYKKSFKAKNFKTKTPTRGMSAFKKPAQLQNVFGAKLEDLTNFKPPVFEKSDKEVAMVKEAMKKKFSFDDMTSDELALFVDAFEPVQVANKTIIIEQGEVGDYFYILAEGGVSFHIEDIQVGDAAQGVSFGELALLYACPRAATVRAETEPTKLYRVDQKTFRSLLQKQTKILEGEKMQLLKNVNFLSEIVESDLKRLGAAMTPKQFKPGDCLVKKGDAGDAFYIVHEGDVAVTDISVGSTTFDDIILKRGDYFGERALATKEPRAANVTAKTKGTAFCIDKGTFEKVLGKFCRVIMKSQNRRTMEGIQVFQPSELQPTQFEELSHLVVDRTFEAGEAVFDSMESTEAALYLLHEGSVQLAGKRSDVIKPGGYFGEDSLLLDTRQTPTSYKMSQTMTMPQYTAKAIEKCVCGVLTLSDCRTIFDTTNMVDTVGFETMIIEEKNGEDSDDEILAAAALAPASSLNRDTTKQWLAKTSKEVFRTCVKTTVGLRDLDRQSILGEGQFGEVWLVSAELPVKYGRQHFALKAQKKDDPTRGNSIEAIKREIDVLGIMDHPYIVNLVHHYEDADHVYILMGLVHGGELFDVIHTELDDGTWTSGLPESDAKFYAMVVADTLDYMHRKNFIFRDLKPENILIDKDGYPILCDLGFAKFVDDKTYTLCGTPNYLSPEVIMNRGHNASSDHWALGVLLYEMVAGENPFYHDGMPQMELFQCIVREKFYPLPDEVSDEAFDVIDELLEKDPAQRLGSLAGRGKDIMAKAFFDELDLAELRQKKFKAPFIPKNKKLDEMVAQSSSGSLHYNDSFVSQSEGSFTLGTVVGSPSGSSAESPNASGYVNLHASAQKSKASLLDDSSDEED